MPAAVSSQVPPALLGVFLPPPEEMRFLHKTAHKELAKESTALAALLASTREDCLAVALDTGMDSNLVVVTDRRTFQYKRGKIRKEMAHSEVANTSIGSLPNQDILIKIESHSSRLDYAPNDPNRFQKILMPHVATPRIAQLICSHIDRRASQPSAEHSNAGQADLSQHGVSPSRMPAVSSNSGQESSAVPRAIPVLFPDFYERVLHATGRPFTADNLGRLCEVCSQMVGGGMADEYFRQTNDQAAHDRFVAEFSGNGYRAHGLHIVDDMIDFLWAWNTACHAELRRQVSLMEQMLTNPQSPVRRWDS